MNTPEALVSFLHNNQPLVTWEIDRDTLDKIRMLKDDAGEYLWRPFPHGEKADPPTLLGISITVASNKCFNLRYEFPDGTTYTAQADFGMLSAI